MRTVAIVLLLAVPVAPILVAQTNSCVSIAGATLIGTFTDTLRQECQTAKPKKDVCGWSICVWFTTQGLVEYSIRAEDIHVFDECGTVDGITTPEIFSMIATQTVTHGAALGYTPCPESGSVQTAVHFAADVGRRGYGSGTTFTSCEGALSRSAFSYACVNSEVMIASAGCSGGSCGNGCEGTCGGGGLE